MNPLLSGLLAGGWPFLVGWVFPSALFLTIFGFFSGTSRQEILMVSLPQLGVGGQVVALTVAAFALALLLSALQTQLYRLLEGYYFPAWLQAARQRRHLRRRDTVRGERDALGTRLRDGAVRARHDTSGDEVRLGLLSERLRRYPFDDGQIAPTRLANAIRAFEVYAWHHFCLDSQTLWCELTSVAPDRTRSDVERARAGVDFFVVLVYLSALGGVVSLVGSLYGRPDVKLAVVGVVALCLVPLWYELAVRSTDNWYQTMQALVNLGRKPLAESLNLTLPSTVEAEREMWRSVGWLVRERYNPQVSKVLKPFSATSATPLTSNREAPADNQPTRQALSP